MGLMAMITGFHGGAIGPGRTLIMSKVAMAIDAKGPFLRVELMGYEYNSDGLWGCLFSPGDGGMAACTVLVHQFIVGRKLAGNDLSRGGVTLDTGDGRRVGTRGEPHLRNFLILMTAQAEKRVAGGKPNQP